jgi:phospholipid/cholesterol/gamma-HCH transport system ATP-binding protein
MIKVQGLYKSFGGQTVLHDINLQIAQGEILVILGESGSGKSVFLQHLIGILKPDQGTIEIDGVDITTLKETQLLSIRKKIGYLFQDGALYDFMTVFENVAFPLKEHTQLSRKDVVDKVNSILKTVGLDHATEKFPSELSGGMRKRAALARSVILDSKIICCDEPTSGLDPIKSRDITDLITQISRQINSTTIVTSHDMTNALRMADRVVLVKEGRIVATGRPDDLRLSTDPFVQAFLDV